MPSQRPLDNFRKPGKIILVDLHVGGKLVVDFLGHLEHSPTSLRRVQTSCSPLAKEAQECAKQIELIHKNISCVINAEILAPVKGNIVFLQNAMVSPLMEVAQGTPLERLVRLCNTMERIRIRLTDEQAKVLFKGCQEILDSSTSFFLQLDELVKLRMAQSEVHNSLPFEGFVRISKPSDSSIRFIDQTPLYHDVLSSLRGSARKTLNGVSHSIANTYFQNWPILKEEHRSFARQAFQALDQSQKS